MKKKYFSALIPESNLDIKYKRIQVDSPWIVHMPPIAILEYYQNPILKKDFNINIDTIKEFKTGPLIKKEDLWGVELPIDPFVNHFKLHDLFIILGKDNNKIFTPPSIDKETIRNWSIGFYELIEWDDSLNNIELTLLWKIKKRRYKG